ncbi:MAG: PEP-CTERM sorting domain-containing protein [Betaproteobacteria bacterium]
MRVRRTFRNLIAILVMGLGASSAGASVLTFAVYGTLTTSFDSLHAGDAFTLKYTVDTSIPGNLIFQSGQTTFVSFDNVTSAMVSIGSWSASSVGITRQIDDPASDQYEMFSSGVVTAPSIGGLDVFYFTLALFDPNGMLVTDAFTPLTNLSPFVDSGFAVVFAGDDTTVGLFATVTSIAVVPEPGTMLLLMIGCAALCWVGWTGGRGDSQRWLLGQ